MRRFAPHRDKKKRPLWAVSIPNLNEESGLATNDHGTRIFPTQITTAGSNTYTYAKTQRQR